ncbi:YycH family regulatory protein [Ureibacillus terrenus]|uniref:YycH family regulatory protein n=1 Tax=Ureibacillus terrenus TaxID=118246 RepID=UPI002E1D7D1E|nr:two-component system activity regulator YycH [Ureibacillus terrenus]
MKYIEQIKSFLLLFLVLLSIALTFAIWTYTPSLQVIEESPVDQLMVGKKKDLQEVIKPYRILVRNHDDWEGTIGTEAINHLMEMMTGWNGSNLYLVQNNMSDKKINDFLRTNQRITLFFADEVPIKVFHSIIRFSQDELPETGFNKLVLDWSKVSADKTLIVYLLSDSHRTLYSTEIKMSGDYFQETVLKALQGLVAYKEIERPENLSLYVPADEMELVQYTYYIDEIEPDMFRDILFYDPNIVRKNIENQETAKYTDGMTLMTVDVKYRYLNYVNPSSESMVEIPASQLLQDSFEFVNEHGGFTGDYRLISINEAKHIVEYQLFKQGFPVLGTDTATRITTTWGENQLFRYKRPYFLLDLDINSEKFNRKVASGLQVVDFIQKTKQLELSEVDDLILGYYIKQNDNDLLYSLEPSWFALSQGSWIRITPEAIGGGNNGLE